VQWSYMERDGRIRIQSVDVSAERRISTGMTHVVPSKLRASYDQPGLACSNRLQSDLRVRLFQNTQACFRVGRAPIMQALEPYSVKHAKFRHLNSD